MLRCLNSNWNCSSRGVHQSNYLMLKMPKMLQYHRGSDLARAKKAFLSKGVFLLQNKRDAAHSVRDTYLLHCVKKSPEMSHFTKNASEASYISQFEFSRRK